MCVDRAAVSGDVAAATDLALGLVGRGLIGLGTWLDRTEPVFQQIIACIK